MSVKRLANSRLSFGTIADTLEITVAGDGGVGDDDTTNDPLNILNYGATCNGVTDDTAAWVSAIAAAESSKRRVIYVTGETAFNPTSLFSSSYPLTIYVNGCLKPSTTIVLPGRTNIIGQGGATASGVVQFGAPSNCEITPPSGNIYVIEMRGSGGAVLENISIHNCKKGILFNGHAYLTGMIRCKRLAIDTDSSSTFDPYVVDCAFWIWFEQCAFLGGTNANSCGLITNSASGGQSTGGLVFFDDCITAGPPNKIDPVVGVCGNVYYKKHHHESQQVGEPIFYFGGASTISNHVGVVHIENFSFSDSYSGAGTIFDCPGMNYRESALTISNCDILPTFLNKPKVVNFLGFSSALSYQKIPIDYCSDSHTKVIMSRGDLDGRLMSRSGGAAKATIGSGTHQAMTPTTSGSFVVTSGQRAPDGSLTAYLCTVPGGADSNHTAYSTQMFNNNVDMDGGDFLIIGCWAKDTQGLDIGGNAWGDWMVATMLGSSGLIFDSPNNESSSGLSITGLAHRWKNAGWAPYYGIAQVSNTRASTPGLAVSISLQSNRSALIWLPYFKVIKAADGYSKSDVIRYMNSIDVVPPGPQGSMSMHAHQAFRTGRNTTANRPSAALMGNGAMFYDTTLSKPIWSNGTVWKDAAGTTV